jgi:hypothetical protein
MTDDRLSLITSIVKACGDEVQAAHAELSEARQRAIRLRGEHAKALADQEAAEIRYREARAELGRWWPEFRSVVTERAREVGAAAGSLTQGDLEVKA